MKHRSPLTVSYKDLLSQAEDSLRVHQSAYNGAIGRGTVSLDILTHKVEVAKMLVRMLRKGLPKKQTELFELFEQVKK